MKQKLMMIAVALMALATPILAQAPGGGPAPVHAPSEWGRLAGAYLGMGIAAGLCGVGQGKATASAAEAMARNPGAVAAIRFALILGLVLIESLALYTLVISFVAR
jgi:F-type H+-transporting ATPase subunit c